MKKEYLNLLDRIIWIIKVKMDLVELKLDIDRNSSYISDAERKKVKSTEEEINSLKKKMQEEKIILDGLDIFDIGCEHSFRKVSMDLRQDMHKYKSLRDDLGLRTEIISRDKRDNELLKEKYNSRKNELELKIKSLKQDFMKVISVKREAKNILIVDDIMFLLEEVFLQLKEYIVVVVESLLEILDKELSVDELRNYLSYLNSLNNIIVVNYKIYEKLRYRGLDEDQKFLIKDYLYPFWQMITKLNNGEIVSEEEGNRCVFYFENVLFLLGFDNMYLESELDLRLFYGSWEEKDPIKREIVKKVN